MAYKVIVDYKGSAKSGNYGHAGRPGKVGGSTPKGLPEAVSASLDGLAKQAVGESKEHFWVLNDDGSIHKTVIGQSDKRIGLETFLNDRSGTAQITDRDTYQRHTAHNHPNGLIGFSPADVRDMATHYNISTSVVGKRSDNENLAIATLSNPDFIKNTKYIRGADRLSAEYEKLMKAKAEAYHKADPSIPTTTVTMQAASDALQELAPKYGLVYEYREIGSKEMTIRFSHKGSSKSGNYGHAGRPGKVGGSMPKTASALPSVDPGYHPANYTKLKDMPCYKHFKANDYVYFENGKGMRGPDNSDGQLDDISHDQGFDGLPHVINQEEFDKFVEAGEIPIYRGLLDPVTAAAKTFDLAVSDKTVQQMTEQFRSGTLHNGWGGYGNGTYTTDSKHTAFSYARDGDKPITGAVLAMTIRKEAKIASITKFDQKIPSAKDPAGVQEACTDIGRLAAMAGYDVVKVTYNYRANASSGGWWGAHDTYYIILNRTAVRVLDHDLTEE